MKRWLRFNAVGIAGAVVQIGVLALLTRAGVHYLVATFVAVECALLHNYYWHVRWTWSDRAMAGNRALQPSLWRFQVANGLVSLISNLVLMRALTGGLAIPAVPANLVAIVLTGLVNFFLGDRWVFVAGH